MKVVGLCGASGMGKTTLAEGLVVALREAGCAVSVIKHTHKAFDIDRPGKDSHRLRGAGAYETLIANRERIALVREWAHGPQATEPDVHALIAQLQDLGPAHWVLVEGFKHADLPKIEVWRHAVAPEPGLGHDPHVVALATPDAPPAPPAVPVLALDPAPVAAFLLREAVRFDYRPPTRHA